MEEVLELYAQRQPSVPDDPTQPKPLSERPPIARPSLRFLTSVRPSLLLWARHVTKENDAHPIATGLGLPSSWLRLGTETAPGKSVRLRFAPSGVVDRRLNTPDAVARNCSIDHPSTDVQDTGIILGKLNGLGLAFLRISLGVLLKRGDIDICLGMDRDLSSRPQRSYGKD